MRPPEGAGAEPSAVFIVDDEADHALIATHVLRGLAPEMDVRVLSALEGLAVALASAPAGAVVLLDRMIGGVESYATLRAVLEARPDLRVTLVSAWLTENFIVCSMLFLLEFGQCRDKPVISPLESEYRCAITAFQMQLPVFDAIDHRAP